MCGYAFQNIKKRASCGHVLAGGFAGPDRKQYTRRHAWEWSQTQSPQYVSFCLWSREFPANEMYAFIAYFSASERWWEDASRHHRSSNYVLIGYSHFLLKASFLCVLTALTWVQNFPALYVQAQLSPEYADRILTHLRGPRTFNSQQFTGNIYPSISPEVKAKKGEIKIDYHMIISMKKGEMYFKEGKNSFMKAPFLMPCTICISSGRTPSSHRLRKVHTTDIPQNLHQYSNSAARSRHAAWSLPPSGMNALTASIKRWCWTL